MHVENLDIQDEEKRPKENETGEKEMQIVPSCETWKEPRIKISYPWFSSDSCKSPVQVLVNWYLLLYCFDCSFTGAKAVVNQRYCNPKWAVFS